MCLFYMSMVFFVAVAFVGIGCQISRVSTDIIKIIISTSQKSIIIESTWKKCCCYHTSNKHYHFITHFLAAEVVIWNSLCETSISTLFGWGNRCVLKRYVEQTTCNDMTRFVIRSMRWII